MKKVSPVLQVLLEQTLRFRALLVPQVRLVLLVLHLRLLVPQVPRAPRDRKVFRVQ